jgi:hypothetical protein
MWNRYFGENDFALAIAKLLFWVWHTQQFEDSALPDVAGKTSINPSFG